MAIKRPPCPHCTTTTTFPGVTHFEGVRIKFFACPKCLGWWHRVRRQGKVSYFLGREFPYMLKSGNPDYEAVARQVRAGETDVDPKR